MYNCGAKHLGKTAGTTKEERESLAAWMAEGRVADAFRRFHPRARGAYTYWSVRANAVSQPTFPLSWRASVMMLTACASA